LDVNCCVIGSFISINFGFIISLIEMLNTKHVYKCFYISQCETLCSKDLPKYVHPSSPWSKPPQKQRRVLCYNICLCLFIYFTIYGVCFESKCYILYKCASAFNCFCAVKFTYSFTFLKFFKKIFCRFLLIIWGW